jgi:hypothetical protein
MTNQENRNLSNDKSQSRSWSGCSADLEVTLCNGGREMESYDADNMPGHGGIYNSETWRPSSRPIALFQTSNSDNTCKHSPKSSNKMFLFSCIFFVFTQISLGYLSVHSRMIVLFFINFHRYLVPEHSEFSRIKDCLPISFAADIRLTAALHPRLSSKLKSHSQC